MLSETKREQEIKALQTVEAVPSWSLYYQKRVPKNRIKRVPLVIGGLAQEKIEKEKIEKEKIERFVSPIHYNLAIKIIT